MHLLYFVSFVFFAGMYGLALAIDKSMYSGKRSMVGRFGSLVFLFGSLILLLLAFSPIFTGNYNPSLTVIFISAIIAVVLAIPIDSKVFKRILAIKNY